MNDNPYLLVGLGNLGEQYTYTRHNIGFSVLDYLARQNNLSFTESRWQAMVISAVLWHSRIFFLKPETYMNLSGSVVAPFINYYNLLLERIIVIHDDIDLPLGRIKIYAGGGSGGHKGIQSIIDCLGAQNFPRLKVGIGRPQLSLPVDQYVLSQFDPEERVVNENNMPFIEDGIRLFCEKGINQAMNFLNRIR